MAPLSLVQVRRMWSPPLQVLLWTGRSIDLEEVQEVIDVDCAISVEVARTWGSVFAAAIIGIGQGIVVLRHRVRAAFQRKDTARIEVGIRIVVQGCLVCATGIET